MWERVDSTLPEGVQVEPLDDDDDQDLLAARLVEFAGPLGSALSGVPASGGIVMVAGMPGAGKSTLVAQAVSGLRAERPRVVWWLDCDQLSKRAVRVLFQRTKSPYGRWVQIVRGGSWRDALSIVPCDDSIMVVDSLQTWARHNLNEALALCLAVKERAEACIRRGGWRQTVFLISESNSDGGPHGLTSFQHAVEAVAIVSEDAVDVPTKLRWARTPRSAPRS